MKNKIGPLNLALILISGLFLWTLVSCSKKETKPNIIFIMSDDHATQAISAYGSKINQTPNIDRLAKEGVLFQNCFCTNSLCAPSRAVILTGKYSHLNGVQNNTQQFNGQQTTFPELLKRAGYQTAIIGKWHLKSVPTGFDYWNILHGQGVYFNPEFINNGVNEKKQGYVTDIITDLSINWLSQREAGKPFCLMVHHKGVHANWETDNKHAKMYSEVKIPEPDSFNDDYTGRTAQISNSELLVGPNLWRIHYQKRFGAMPFEGNDQEIKEWMYQRFMKDYLKCVASVDDNIGRILDYLSESGLAENTIVVYTSDQGFFLGEHGLYDKRFMYEESIRMPLIIRYPKEIEPATTANEIVLNLDFAETFLDYAGIETPKSMQGMSFRQIAKREKVENWRNEMYYRFYEKAYGIGPNEGIRTSRYKLIKYLYGDEGWELYDLIKDPEELKNLYNIDRFQDIKTKLKQQMDSLKIMYQF